MAITILTNAQFNALDDVQAGQYLDDLISIKSSTLAGIINGINKISRINSLLTPARLNSLPTSVLSGIASYVVQYFTINQITSLDAPKYGYLTASQVKAFSPVAIRALGSKINGFTLKQISALTNLQVSYITGDQFIALGTSQIQKFSTTQVQAISGEAISSMGNTLSRFTPSQLIALTPKQSFYIQAFQWKTLPIDSATAILLNSGTGLSPSVISSLNKQEVQSISFGSINFFKVEQISSLSYEQVGWLLPKQVSALSATLLSALSKHSKALSLDSVIGLTADQYKALSTTSIPTHKTLSMLSQDEVSRITTETMSAIGYRVFEDLSISSVSYFTSAQSLNLTSSQALSIKNGFSSSLSKKPVSLMSLDEFSKIPIDDIKLLSAKTISSLTAAQFKQLINGDKTRAAVFDSKQISAITAAQLSGLPGSYLSYFSSSQISMFSKNAFLGLNDYSLNQVKNVFGGDNTFFSDPSKNALSSLSMTDWKNSMKTNSFDKPLPYGSIVTRNLESAMLMTIQQSNLMENYSPISRTYSEIKDYFLSYSDNAKAYRQVNTGFRLWSSAITMAGSSQLFYRAFQDSQNSKGAALISKDIITGLHWLSNSLQVPWALMYKAYNAYSAAQTAGDSSPQSAFWKSFKTEIGIVAIENYFSSLKSDPKNNSVIFSGFIISTADPKTIGSTFTLEGGKAKSLSNVDITGTNKSIMSDLKTLEYRTDKLTYAKSGAAINLVTGILGLSAGIANMVELKNSDKADDKALIALGAVSITASAMTVAVNVLDLFFSQSAASVVASRLQSLLGISLTIAWAASSGVTLYNDAMNYEKSKSQGSLIALIGDSITTTITLASMIVATAVGGPVVGLIAGLVSLVLPNFTAIGQAVDIKNQMNDMYNQGRWIIADKILSKLHAIASLNSTPIVNLFSLVYTNKILSEIYSDMSSGDNWRLALLQDLRYAIGGTTDGASFVSKVKASFTTFSGSGMSLNQSVIIKGTSAKEVDYYVSNNSSASRSYISLIGVKKEKDVADTAIYWGSETIFLSDVSNSDIQSVTILDDSTWSGIIKIDARSSNKSTQFNLYTSKVEIWGGSGGNKYVVSSDLTYSFVIHGGSITNTDGTTSYADQLIVSGTGLNQINLDNIYNVSVTGGSAKNNVVGTKERQAYKGTGGKDTVSMSGGNSVAMLTGRGNSARFSGAKNYLYSIMGSGFNITDQAGYYDGGATFVTSIDSDSANTIDFSGSLNSLKITVSSINELSSVETIGGDYADISSFKNFHNIVGGNLNDEFVINSGTSYTSTKLGSGSNLVSVINSSNVNIYGGAGISNLDVYNSSVYFVSVDGVSYTNIGVGSSFTGLFKGVQDEIYEFDGGFSASSKKGIDAVTSTGFHKLNLNNGLTTVKMMANGLDGENKDNVTYIQDCSERKNLLSINLGDIFSEEYVYSGSDGVEFYSKYNNQVLKYTPSVGSVASSNSVFISDLLGKSRYSLSLITQALASETFKTSANSSTFYGNKAYNFNDLIKFATS